MAKNCILTIIVPAYNISKYIDECVPSYIDERLIGRIKVIFIDDGATDNTKEILTPYLNEYSNLFYFFHKNNGGHGSVINFAIAEGIVNTKFFKVIDGDDWVDTYELCKLIDYLDKCDDDLVITGYFRGLPGNLEKIEPLDDKYKKLLINPKTSYGPEHLYKFNLLLHTITYKTKAYTNGGFSLPEKVFYDDNLYRVYPLQNIQTFSFIYCYPYCYRFGVEGQSVSLSSSFKHRSDNIIVTKELLKFYSEVDPSSPIKNVVKDIIASRVGFKSLVVCSNNNGEAIKLCKELWSCFKQFPDLKKCAKHKCKSNSLLINTNFVLVPIFRIFWKKNK